MLPIIIDMLPNIILMLSLISMGSKKGWLGITKLQKLTFLTEYNLSLKNIRAFDYEFFMYDVGPMSLGVYEDFKYLISEGLITEDEDGVRLSKHGQEIYEQFKHLIPKEVNSNMKKIVNNYAKLKTKELVKKVHKMKVRLPDGAIGVIDKLSKSTSILPKPLKTAIKVKKDYIETFHILRKKAINGINSVNKKKK